MKTALVIPSNREDRLVEFLQNWENSTIDWDLKIIVEDNQLKTFDLDQYLLDQDIHVSWEEINKDLGDNSWIISKKDSAIRCYGFFLAWKKGATHIFTLDDDCRPIDSNYITKHIENIVSTPKWIESIPGQRTRGFPYFNKGISKKVVMSVGLWTGIPDYDAIQTLSNAPPISNLPESRIMPHGQYFPLCGMNCCFVREILPLCYFPLQGEGCPYRRFDDIWFGIIAKKICDHLHLQISVGKPYINHLRASDPMVNLVKESPGIAFNEKFWEIIDSIKLIGQNPIDCMNEVGKFLFESGESDYVVKLGKAIQIWSQLFNHSIE